MDGIVFFGCILTGQLKDDFCTAGMFGDKFCYVVDVAVEDYPAAVLGVVLGDWGGGDQPFDVVRSKGRVRLPSS